MTSKIELKGRVILSFDIATATGLHIGGSDTGIEIGGVDKTVIRDALSNRPYIPGSSLRGKMRSLLEKYEGKTQNKTIGRDTKIHSCEDTDEYSKCNICQVFGVPAENNFSTPTRLIVRDTQLSDGSAKKLEDSGRTSLPYTEVKTEVSIDRVTSAANPRQMERVPAGVTFENAEMVYSIYEGDRCNAAQDVDRVKTIVEGLRLLEDDYLGGQGSRGSGKVALQNIRVQVKNGTDYLGKPVASKEFKDLQALADGLSDLTKTIHSALGV